MHNDLETWEIDQSSIERGNQYQLTTYQQSEKSNKSSAKFNLI